MNNKHHALGRHVGLLMAVTAGVIGLGPLSGCAGSKGGQATPPSTTSPASGRSGVTPSGIPARTASSALPGAATSAPASDYVDGGKTSPGVNITFGDADTSNPAAATAAWKANLKAFPSTVIVQGIGDGAVYYIAKGGVTAFNFISNGITCNMYTGNFKADHAHMATLAESILQG